MSLYEFIHSIRGFLISTYLYTVVKTDEDLLIVLKRNLACLLFKRARPVSIRKEATLLQTAP